jgi:purine-binding chemotaxis protein CheW
MTTSIFRGFSESDIKILKARAERAARAQQDEGQIELLTVLSVAIGPERYALPIDAVSSVYEGLALTRVPCAPASVAGVTNVRGRIVLVLDLSVLLNVSGYAKVGSPNNEIVLVTLADAELDLALLVTSVNGVETIRASTLSPVPDTLDAEKLRHIRGLAEAGFALLDVASVINDPTFTAVI